jgi:putative DNA methylase
MSAINGVATPLIATDPPYYDNIGYADLADFFYIWLRRALGRIYPDLFSTLLTPKEHELVATPYRFGGSKEKAEQFFEHGLGQAFGRMRAAQSDEYPLTLFYAFKQSERDDGNGNLTSTGWETMLEGLLAAGFSVTGTWPIRSELSTRNRGRGSNALASSIVLACRPRPSTAGLATRREFSGALKAELPSALKKLQHGNIAPVDLAQAAIGPGMAVFSRYARVIEADGSPMQVRTALGLMNQVLDEVLTEQESEYDTATRWAVAWFEQFGMAEAPYGDAETLAKAKNIAVGGLVEDGFLRARGGKVRLLTRDELRFGWDPTIDSRLTVWEVTQHLMRVLDGGGEQAAAGLLRKLGAGYGETARDLAYRLFHTCERKGWQEEAFAYNSLVIAWPEISRLAGREPEPSQTGLF